MIVPFILCRAPVCRNSANPTPVLPRHTTQTVSLLGFRVFPLQFQGGWAFGFRNDIRQITFSPCRLSSSIARESRLNVLIAVVVPCQASVWSRSIHATPALPRHINNTFFLGFRAFSFLRFRGGWAFGKKNGMVVNHLFTLPSFQRL